jgi:hypothetical protein
MAIMTSTDFSQLTHDQLNNRIDLLQQNKPQTDQLIRNKRRYDIVDSGAVLNYTSKAMKLTRGRLLKHNNWSGWQHSEYLQIDKYEDQGMFGTPIQATTESAVFHLVWTYNVKAADERKKARCACDGSTRSGHVQILDETYAICVDQTSARLFYAVAAGENMLVFGADVSNAFSKAPTPKQGFYIFPDGAFHVWWMIHKKTTTTPPQPRNTNQLGYARTPRIP